MTNTEPAPATEKAQARETTAKKDGPAVIQVRNPGTGEVVGTVPDETAEAVA
ncbi:hypothetical protein [Nocardia abscessus]|nr:hypothetical protein [Nocardia abscessus]